MSAPSGPLAECDSPPLTADIEGLEERDRADALAAAYENIACSCVGGKHHHKTSACPRNAYERQLGEKLLPDELQAYHRARDRLRKKAKKEALSASASLDSSAGVKPAKAPPKPAKAVPKPAKAVPKAAEPPAKEDAAPEQDVQARSPSPVAGSAEPPLEDIIRQQAEMIEKQGAMIEQLRALLRDSEEEAESEVVEALTESSASASSSGSEASEAARRAWAKRRARAHKRRSGEACPGAQGPGFWTTFRAQAQNALAVAGVGMAVRMAPAVLGAVFQMTPAQPNETGPSAQAPPPSGAPPGLKFA